MRDLESDIDLDLDIDIEFGFVRTKRSKWQDVENRSTQPSAVGTVMTDG